VSRPYLAPGQLGEESVRVERLVDLFDDVVVELVLDVLLVQRLVVRQEDREGVLPAAVQTDRVLETLVLHLDVVVQQTRDDVLEVFEVLCVD